MDRNFFYRERAQEHQREISQQLANRQLLGGAEASALPAKQVQRWIMNAAPAAITIGVLLLLISFG